MTKPVIIGLIRSISNEDKENRRKGSVNIEVTLGVFICCLIRSLSRMRKIGEMISRQGSNAIGINLN